MLTFDLHVQLPPFVVCSIANARFPDPHRFAVLIQHLTPNALRHLWVPQPELPRTLSTWREENEL